MRTLLSIICPVHNEAQCVPLFYERLMDALGPVKDADDIELMFMNNRSTDRNADEVRSRWNRSTGIIGWRASATDKAATRAQPS